MPSPNPLLTAVAVPPIPTAKAWLGAYDGALGSAIDLSQAVPGEPPHPSILADLARAAASSEAACYGPIRGDLPLREALGRDMTARYGAPIAAADLSITAGCNQAFYAVVQTLAKAGEAILLPTPWYFNHQMTLAMLGIEPRPVVTTPEDGFVPALAAIEAAMDERVRALALVTPNNPTGAIYPPEVLAAIHEFCRARDIYLIVDETYRDFLPDPSAPPHALFGEADWRDRLIQLYSFSKSYCMPGHRLGAVAAGPVVLDQLEKVQDCMQICPPRVGQIALVPAIRDLADWRAANGAEILRRAEAFKAVFAPLNGWRVDAIGAYFAYLRHPFEDHTSTEVAEALARERGLLMLPGAFFGDTGERHLRAAFANVDVATVERIGERLAGFSL